MTPYPKYKPSGIEWIGDIPEKWDIKPVKYLLQKGKEGIRIGPFGSSLRAEFITLSGLKVYGQENIINNDFKAGWRFISEDKFIELIDYEIRPGDVLVTMMGTTGKCKVVPPDIEKGIMDSHLIRMRIDDSQFLPQLFADLINSSYYLFNQMKMMSKGSIMEGLNSSIVKNLFLLIPPQKEQTAIATYLDEKTAQIDTLIAQKQKLAAMLKEERTAMINRAVTKGINPKVKMKPSGIEWLGDIPEHWAVKKLKYVANVVLGKMLTNDDKGGFYLKPYLRAANMQWLSADVSNVKEMWFSANELKKLRVLENDLLVSEGGEVGRTCIWRNELDECYIQNSVHKITFEKSLNSFFFLYQFYLMGSIGYFESIVNRISIGHLTGEKLQEIFIWFPSLKEQTEIVHYIETQTQRIDTTLSKIEQEIGLLQEYRTALISEVVTGKVKVD